MRVLPCLSLLVALPGIAVAQSTDFKIYPGTTVRFDSSCTSFTSRCSLGGDAGEILQEYPMQSHAVNGASTDFFRGIGEAAFPAHQSCALTGVFFMTQDEMCLTQQTYDVIVRVRYPLGCGPDPNNATAPIPPGSLTLMTPPNGPPSPCAWGIVVSLATPLAVPCDRSIFAGLGLPAEPTWGRDGQSLQAAYLEGGGAARGDPASQMPPRSRGN